MSKKPNKKAKFLRFLRNKQNKIMKTRRRLKNCRRKNVSHYVHSNNYYESNIIKLLEKNNFKKWTKRKKTGSKIKIPKIFSFIKNPDETINTLKEILYCGVKKNIHKIKFDYSECEELSLCASLVTDLIILELLKNRNVELSGNSPKTVEAQQIFYISGLLKHLGISKVESKNVERLEILSNLPDDEVSQKVVEYYQRCLKTQGLDLTDLGKNRFSNMVGEVIDNARQYCGDLGSWHATGHFDIQQGKEYGKCRLVLMNFGNSIYESLKQEDTTKYMRDILEKHTKKNNNYFEVLFNEEVLWTVYSLQQNVSKKRVDKTSDRGNGTIKLIKNFMDIGANRDGDRPIMSLISGKSHIVFDGTYNLIDENKEGKTVPIIAFNKTNDLNKKPDSKYAKLINNKFPGTIITMEFYLDIECFAQILSGGIKNDKF